MLRKGDQSPARIGDRIVVVIQKARTVSTILSGATSNINRVKRGDICHAIVVRTKQPTLRKDGSIVRFDDNACVLINKNGEPLGTRVSSVVARELKEKSFNKIVSMAPKIV